MRSAWIKPHHGLRGHCQMALRYEDGRCVGWEVFDTVEQAMAWCILHCDRSFVTVGYPILDSDPSGQ